MSDYENGYHQATTAATPGSLEPIPTHTLYIYIHIYIYIYIHICVCVFIDVDPQTFRESFLFLLALYRRSFLPFLAHVRRIPNVLLC